MIILNNIIKLKTDHMSVKSNMCRVIMNYVIKDYLKDKKVIFIDPKGEK